MYVMYMLYICICVIGFVLHLSILRLLSAIVFSHVADGSSEQLKSLLYRFCAICVFHLYVRMYVWVSVCIMPCVHRYMYVWCACVCTRYIYTCWCWGGDTGIVYSILASVCITF